MNEEPAISFWSNGDEINYILGLDYIHQKDKGYSCCYPIAILNAAIFYGKEVVKPSNRTAWELLVDACRCRHGSALDVTWLWGHYNFTNIPLPPKIDAFDHVLGLNVPIIIYITDQLSSIGNHAALIVAQHETHYHVVNLKGKKGDLLSKVSKQDVYEGICGSDGVPRIGWPDAVIATPVGRTTGLTRRSTGSVSRQADRFFLC